MLVTALASMLTGSGYSPTAGGGLCQWFVSPSFFFVPCLLNGVSRVYCHQHKQVWFHHCNTSTPLTVHLGLLASSSEFSPVPYPYPQPSSQHISLRQPFLTQWLVWVESLCVVVRQFGQRSLSHFGSELCPRPQFCDCCDGYCRGGPHDHFALAKQNWLQQVRPNHTCILLGRNLFTNRTNTMIDRMLVYIFMSGISTSITAFLVIILVQIIRFWGLLAN